jgi:hypothetical protein
MNAQAQGVIDWDHMREYTQWQEEEGLVVDQILYFQSGVPNTSALPMLAEGEVFEVPEGTSMIFGAFAAVLVLNGESMSHTDGFYAVLEEGTQVDSLMLTDGFALLVVQETAQVEFCARVAQAQLEGWAHNHVYHPEVWSEPVCEGAVSVPLDSDR